MIEKRVGIVTPLALASVPVEFHLSYLANMTYLQSHIDELPFKVKDIRMIAPHTFPIDANRNECVAWAKKWDCDITVWFDADQDLRNYGTEEQDNDVLFRLLKDGFEYPIYAGIYYLKKLPFHPIVFKADADFKGFQPIWKFPPDKLFYADMIGMGCCKIDREILDKLDHPFFKYNVMPKKIAGTGDLTRFRYDNKVADVSEDVAFWRQVKKKTGERIVIDPKIQVGHVTNIVVNTNVFQGHMNGSMEQIKIKKGDKFEAWYNTICEAELL